MILGVMTVKGMRRIDVVVVLDLDEEMCCWCMWAEKGQVEATHFLLL